MINIVAYSISQPQDSHRIFPLLGSIFPHLGQRQNLYRNTVIIIAKAKATPRIPIRIGSLS